MNTEIERKFLVKDTSFLKEPHKAMPLHQGYLSTRPTVRVRTNGETGFITVKGETHNITRKEYEYTIPLQDAVEMLELCATSVVKTRHLIPVGRHVFEVDVYEGANAGLVVAEVELASEDEAFERPAWLGDEVSHDARYMNWALAAHPFSQWKEM